MFNVPFGKYTRINYIRDFEHYRGRLSSWTFLSGDLEAVPLDARDFVYADPPRASCRGPCTSRSGPSNASR